MRPGFQPRLRRGNRVLDCFAAGVPNLRLAPALALTADTVVRAQSHQLGSVANLHAAQLSSQVRKIDIARMLIGRIDSDVAARFASAIVISDRAATARRRKTAGGVKARVLHSGSKRCRSEERRVGK